jgi:outer membrane lipoprotein-sorting protein
MDLFQGNKGYSATLILLILFFCIPRINSEEIRTFQSDFERIAVSPTGTSSYIGNLFYTAPDIVLIKFESPHHQMMLFEGEEVIIYYPEEHKGFRFISMQKQLATFPQTFLGALKNDFGLAEAGFTIVLNQQREEHLLTYWSPPQELRTTIDRILVVSQGGHPVSIEALDPKDGILFRVSYDDFKTIHGNVFPVQVTSVRYDDGRKYSEVVRYYNQKVNEPLPLDIENFSIPEDADMKDVQW